MNLYNELVNLLDEKYNHRIIVHGIHGERTVIRVPLATFVLRVCVLDEKEELVREYCDFPIKEIVINPYNKVLTENQYSALLTFLAYCKPYRVPLPNDGICIVYKVDKELRYDKAFKQFLNSNIDFEENAYLLGYSTGDISCLVGEHSYANDVLRYLAYAAAHSLPECVLNEENYDAGDDPEIPYGDQVVGPFPESAFTNIKK